MLEWSKIARFESRRLPHTWVGRILGCGGATSARGPEPCKTIELAVETRSKAPILPVAASTVKGKCKENDLIKLLFCDFDD